MFSDLNVMDCTLFIPFAVDEDQAHGQQSGLQRIVTSTRSRHERQEERKRLEDEIAWCRARLLMLHRESARTLREIDWLCAILRRHEHRRDSHRHGESVVARRMLGALLRTRDVLLESIQYEQNVEQKLSRRLHKVA